MVEGIDHDCERDGIRQQASVMDASPRADILNRDVRDVARGVQRRCPSRRFRLHELVRQFIPLLC